MGSIWSSHAGRSSHNSQQSSSKSTSKTNNTEGKIRSSAYDANFGQRLVDHGIYMNNQKSIPSNINEIRQRLAQPRPSLSPSRFSEEHSRAFDQFRQKNEDAINEGDVIRNILLTIYGDDDDVSHILHKQDLLFTRLESITENTTVDAKPDFYDGAPLESIDKQVQEDLSPYIIPTGHRTAPVAPNFFIEAKGPQERIDMAGKQIAYDLSLGARAMHELQSYGEDKLVFDNNAYTLGATYYDGCLRMFATHVTPSGLGGSPEYHTTQVGGWSITGNPDDCLRRVRALRNARDMTMEWRGRFILAANQRAQSAAVEPSTFDDLSNYKSSVVSDTMETCLTDITEESDISADELLLPTIPSTTSYFVVVLCLGCCTQGLIFFPILLLTEKLSNPSIEALIIPAGPCYMGHFPFFPFVFFVVVCRS